MMVAPHIPIYQSGTSKIAVLHLETPDELSVLEPERLLPLIRDIYQKSRETGLSVNKLAIIELFGDRDVFRVHFIQYVPQTDQIDKNGNCGNALIVSFLYLLEMNLIRQEAVMESVNTGQVSRICDLNESVGTSHTVLMEFLNPAGSMTKSLLPTGSPRDRLAEKGELLGDVSVVDAGNPYVWLKADRISARDLFLWGRSEYNKMMRIRRKVQQVLQIDPNSVFPKVAVIASSTASTHHLRARMISVPSWHPSFATTGIVNLSTAAVCEGTIVHERILQAKREFDGQWLAVQTPDGTVHARISQGRRRQIDAVSIKQNVQRIGGIQDANASRIIV